MKITKLLTIMTACMFAVSLYAAEEKEAAVKTDQTGIDMDRGYRRNCDRQQIGDDWPIQGGPHKTMLTENKYFDRPPTQNNGNQCSQKGNFDARKYYP